MSRDGRDDPRQDAERGGGARDRETPQAPRESYQAGRDLDLPRSDEREPVQVGDRIYHLRGSESEALATIGAFRVVPAADLDIGGRDVWHGDVQRLADQGLIERTRVTINGEPTDLLSLTRSGKAVLDERRSDDGPRAQQYHAGLVKPRELSHDAQLYRLFQAEARRIQDEGGRVVRVVLDYELKHDYQTFLNRPDRDGASPDEDVHRFAAAARLAVIDGHVELPDLRIEYETSDGRLESRDVELVTEHYSRGQVAGKAKAGFTLYQAAGRGRLRGSPSRPGGSPQDPQHMARLA